MEANKSVETHTKIIWSLKSPVHASEVWKAYEALAVEYGTEDIWIEAWDEEVRIFTTTKEKK